LAKKRDLNLFFCADRLSRNSWRA